MSEEKNVNEEQGGNAVPPAGDAQKAMDDYLEQHMQRWQQRVQIIVAVAAVFLVFTIWFMMHA